MSNTTFFTVPCFPTFVKSSGVARRRCNATSILLIWKAEPHGSFVTSRKSHLCASTYVIFLDVTRTVIPMKKNLDIITLTQYTGKVILENRT